MTRMPTFLINAIGQPIHRVKLDALTVAAGRDPTANTLVIPSETVSRQHAVFQRDEKAWQVENVSQRSTLLLNGAVVRQSTRVKDGDVLLFGDSYLMRFFETDEAADTALGQQEYTSLFECTKCGWSAFVTSAAKSARCAKCDSTDLITRSFYAQEVLDRHGPSKATMHLTPGEAQQAFKTVRAATMSRLERLDDHDPGHARVDLNENEPIAIDKEDNAALRLHGIVLGGGLTIAWEDDHYIVASDLTYPSLKVNGTKAMRSRLWNGDVLEVGSNKFRFVIG
jgi:hypothetical protein